MSIAVHCPIVRLKAKLAFTLVELLVVIAIVAILATLLFPVIGVGKEKARRSTCMSNLRQINLSLRTYTDDFSDLSPKTPHTNNFPTLENLVDFTGYKNLIRGSLGLSGQSSSRDAVFACPDDRFYYDLSSNGKVATQGLHEQAFTDYSSYGFNGATGTNLISGRIQSIAGMKLSSIKEPARTLLVFEIPAIFPFSWHEPRRPLSAQNSVFNNARNMASFVDGHASFIRFYWNSNRVEASGVSYITDAVDYDPPAGYDYKWSGD
jgi:prepilin-type N-terminal cleavage/methylation domain-containing protein